jgi:hypothetical protein
MPVSVKIGAKALKLELLAHGKTEAATWTAKKGAPVLRDVMGGDIRAPAVVGLNPVEAAERLKKPLYSQLALCDCTLHDLKGEAALNDRIIHSRQSTEGKSEMNRVKANHGQGAMRASMCGRDWRVVIATGEMYAMCTAEEQELQLTLSIMSDTGLYKPPEDYCNNSIVAYSLYATWYGVQKKALFGTENGRDLPTKTKLGGVTLAAVFGRYFKAVAVTNVVTYRLEPLRDGSTEREEETYAEVKHHVDKSFYAGNIEESMLKGINRCAGMVATSKKLRQTSDPTGKGEGTARRHFRDTLAKQGMLDQYLKVFRVPTKMLLSDDFVIWLILFCDLWIRNAELGLTAPIIIRELPGAENLHTRRDGYKVRALEIDLARADDEHVMGRFNSRCDNRETLVQHIINKIFRPHFFDKADAVVPSWDAADLRAWIQKDSNRELQQRLGVGVGVGGDGGSWLASLSTNIATSSDAVDVDSEISEAIREEKKREQEEEQLQQDKRMLELLQEQEKGLGRAITRRIDALNHEDEGEGKGAEGGSGVGGGGLRSDQESEDAIQTMAQELDDSASPAVLAAREELFMESEVQETEVEQMECIYPQPEGRASRVVRESTEQARAEQQQRQQAEGRWGGVDTSGDEDGSDNWEQELMCVEIDHETRPGELRDAGQQARLSAMSEARHGSGGVLLSDRLSTSGSAAQEAAKELQKKRRQIGALVMHKEHARQLYNKLKTKIEALEAGLRGVPAPGGGGRANRGRLLQERATAGRGQI